MAEPNFQRLHPELAAWLSAQGFDPARPEAPGKPGVIATLLELGANPRLLSQDDFSALDMAASRECLQLLRAAARKEVA